MRTKNRWAEYCIFDFVNWKVHGKAIKSFEHKRVHLTKYLVHEGLPTYHKANLMDGGNRKCVTCGTCDETVGHNFKCLAHSRQEWQTSWWKKIDRFHEEQAPTTSPRIPRIYAPAYTVSSPVTFPQEVRILIQRQNAIGWRHVLRGRFSHEWESIQNAY